MLLNVRSNHETASLATYCFSAIQRSQKQCICNVTKINEMTLTKSTVQCGCVEQKFNWRRNSLLQGYSARELKVRAVVTLCRCLQILLLNQQIPNVQIAALKLIYLFQRPQITIFYLLQQKIIHKDISNVMIAVDVCKGSVVVEDESRRDMQLIRS